MTKQEIVDALIVAVGETYEILPDNGWGGNLVVIEHKHEGYYSYKSPEGHYGQLIVGQSSTGDLAISCPCYCGLKREPNTSSNCDLNPESIRNAVEFASKHRCCPWPG
jgi:hypothetical protein